MAGNETITTPMARVSQPYRYEPKNCVWQNFLRLVSKPDKKGGRRATSNSLEDSEAAVEYPGLPPGQYLFQYLGKGHYNSEWNDTATSADTRSESFSVV